MSRRYGTVAERLERLSIPEPNSGCTLWLGRPSTSGYGQMAADGQHRMVHRVAYELELGPIPDGLSIDHLCSNRLCVNPRHLEAVTPRTNVLRGNTIAARNAAKTHCLRGHLLDEANTYRRKTGRARLCKACVRLHGAARRRALVQAGCCPTCGQERKP